MSSIIIFGLSFAALVIIVVSFWYLFQTVRIMWGYSFLLAIAAVLFSPLVHIIFYFIPKDGFDQYERGLFKKYFLSIAALMILGVVVSIVIPSIIGENQTSEMTSEVDTSQPWDWDIRAENQEDVLALTNNVSNDDKAAELHFQAIYQAHPDADEVMESPEFEGWAQGKPEEEQDNIARILKEGTTAEVIYIFSTFKKDLKSYRAYEYQAKRDNAHAITQREYEEKQSRDLEAMKSNSQKHYEAQRTKQVAEYVEANRALPLPAAQEISTKPTSSYSVPKPSASSTPGQIVNCDGAGCWDTNGTRYNRGAGDTYFPSTGGVCQNVGGQMNCS